MKHLLFFSCLALFFVNCNDDLVFDQTEEIVTTTSTEPEEVDDSSVYFSDTVLDDESKPVAGAIVAIYASNVRYSDVTDENGEYDITVPTALLPKMGFISLSITYDLFKPVNLTYQAPLIAETVYDGNVEVLSLVACPTCLTIGEKSSELFHLGDDNYNGSENSQFQKSTDGQEMEFQVEGSEDYKTLDLSFQIKGIQPDHFLEDNRSSIQLMAGEDIVAEEILDEKSPEDGSFGMYEITIDNTQPITGIKFITRNHGEPGSDYDDWEFTCLYVLGGS